MCRTAVELQVYDSAPCIHQEATLCRLTRAAPPPPPQFPTCPPQQTTTATRLPDTDRVPPAASAWPAAVTTGASASCCRRSPCWPTTTRCARSCSAAARWTPSPATPTQRPAVSCLKTHFHLHAPGTYYIPSNLIILRLDREYRTHVYLSSKFSRIILVLYIGTIIQTCIVCRSIFDLA